MWDWGQVSVAFREGRQEFERKERPTGQLKIVRACVLQWTVVIDRLRHTAGHGEGQFLVAGLSFLVNCGVSGVNFFYPRRSAKGR